MIMKVETGLPIFLETNPAVICDQVLKKNFFKVWNQTSANPVFNQYTQETSQHVKSEKHSQQQTEVSDLLIKVETLNANLDEALKEKNHASLFQL